MHELSAFTYVPTAADWYHILPELILMGTALVVLLADLVIPAGYKSWLAVVGLAGVVASVAMASIIFSDNYTGTVFYNMMSGGQAAMFANIIVLFAVGVGLVFSPGFVQRQSIVHEGEYYALMLLSALGMMLMSSAMNLMTIFVGLEVLSLSLYVLCAIIAGRFRSQESGMKYFILSSFASAFLLYGMALTYGSTGNTALTGIRAFLDAHPTSYATGFGPLLVVGLGLMAVGFLFKVSAIPFQAWTPDVYVGAPTTVTAFMSVGTKVAAFVAMVRVFYFALHPLFGIWQPVFWVIAILTMIGGNLLAVTQRDVKRMLAYSSVANAGYMLVAVATATAAADVNRRNIAALFVYLACYAAMNLGAFGVVLVVERNNGTGTSLDDFAGLSRRQPWVAAAMAVFMFSLAGIPATSGFIGKWYVFYAAIAGGHLELAIIGVVASLAGVFYYLRVIWAMYFTEPQPPVRPFVVEQVAVPEPVVAIAAVSTAEGSGGTLTATATAPVPMPVAQPIAAPRPAVSHLTWNAGLGLAIAAIVTLGIGIFPGGLVQVAITAANALLR